MRARFVPLSLLLLALSSCPIQQDYAKPKEISKENYTIQINVKANRNNYSERVKDFPVNTMIIGSTKSQLESKLKDSEDALREVIKKDVELFLREQNKEEGVYSIETEIIYQSGRTVLRTVLMIDDFELGENK